MIESAIQDTDRKQIENKIAAARTKLILDKPFLGALVLRLELQEADAKWCATTGTDAKKFYYNHAYIEELKGAELQFVLAHEALHCALSHFARRQHRVKHRWDLACDYAINPILVDEGLTPPPNLMIFSEYRGLTAEEIYPLIKDNDHSETMDQHLYDKQDKPKEGGQDKQTDELNQQNTKEKNKPQDHQSERPRKSNRGDMTPDQDKSSNQPSEQEQDYNPNIQGPLSAPPPTLSPQEIEAQNEKWQQRLAGAAQQAKQSGKLSEALSRFIDAERVPKLSWRTMLASYLSSTARDDYSYARPNARRGDPAIYPTLRSTQLNMVVAIDVSGSISDSELNECISEINAIKGQLRAKVTILAADDKISDGFPKVFESWDDIDLIDPIFGGGGTNFLPAFDWIAAQDIAPDVFVYFTDAQGKFPDYAPSFPVIWLVKGKTQVPWGQRIQLT